MFRTRLLAGSALVPAALAVALPARAEILINGTNLGSAVTIDQFPNATLTTSETETIGLLTNGAFTQGDGTNSVTNGQAIVLGEKGGATGTYDLAGGAVSANVEIVGRFGIGSFTQTGGSNTLPAGGPPFASGGPTVPGGTLVLGASEGAQGSYTLQAGTLSAVNEQISASGAGTGAVATFIQSGGVNTVSGTLALTPRGAGTGLYDLQGGTLDANAITVNTGGTFRFDGGTARFSTFAISDGAVTAAGDERLDAPGGPTTVTITQTGGSNIATSALRVGGTAGTTGTYHLSGGMVQASDILVGNAGSGHVTQSGGSVTATNTMVLGNLSGSVGTYDQSGGTNSVNGAFVIGNEAGSSGSYTLSDGTLTTGVSFVGINGTGTFTQTGGTHAIPAGPNRVTFGEAFGTEGVLVVGVLDGSQGTYNLKGGALTVGLEEVIGASNGNGVLSQTGGTNTTVELDIAQSPGASGRYELKGGALTALRENFGAFGQGVFSQTGGTNTTGSLTISFVAGANGTYELNGGTLAATNIQVNTGGTFKFNGGTAKFSTFEIAGGAVTASGDEILDATGGPTTVAVTQTGGSNTVTSALRLGFNAGTTGTYTLSGGTVQAFDVVVGDAGSGHFSQSGGSVNATNSIVIGNGSGAVGAYDLRGGSLTATTVNIGTFGGSTGAMTQSGGAATVSGALILGNQPGASGSYTLSDGTLTTGDTNVGLFGTGIFTQTGGTHTILGGPTTVQVPGISEFTGGLLLGGRNDSQGTYNLQGGALTTSYEILGTFNNSRGVFTQTGGTNTTSQLVIANTDNASGSYELRGGTLAASDIAVGTNGTFTLAGGTANIGTGGFQNAGLLEVKGKGGTINGDVSNTGRVTVTATSVAFNGNFTNSGAYQSTASTQRFGTLTNTPAGTLQGGRGDRFVVTGDFLNHSTQGALWQTSLSVLEFAAGASDTHRLLLAGANLGKGQAGYLDNFAWGTLELDAGESLILGDGLASDLVLAAATAGGPSGEALYVQELLGAAISGDEITNITGDGLDIYYDPDLEANFYLGGRDYALVGGGELIADRDVPSVPEPSTLALIVPGLSLACAMRRRGRRAGGAAPATHS